METHKSDDIQAERPERPSTDIQANPPPAPVADRMPLPEYEVAKRPSWWDTPMWDIPMPICDLLIGGAILIVLALTAVSYLGQVTNKTFSNISICGPSEYIHSRRQELEKQERDASQRSQLRK